MGAGPPGGRVQGSSRGPGALFSELVWKDPEVWERDRNHQRDLTYLFTERKKMLFSPFLPTNQHKLFGYKL